MTGYGFAGLIVGLIALIEVTSIGRAWESFEQKMQRDANAAGSQLAPGYVNGDLGMFLFSRIRFVTPSFSYFVTLVSID